MLVPNDIVPESSKVQALRGKLQRLFEVREQLTTPESIQTALQEINQRIARHTPERISLREKSIDLFDANRNSAPPSRQASRRIEALMQRVRSEQNLG